MKMAVFWVVMPCSLVVCSLAITLMMEAASTSEMLVNFYQTTRNYNPEDSHLHTCHHENLKSHKIKHHYQESLPLGITLNKVNSVHTFTTQFCNIQLKFIHAHPSKIILPSLSWTRNACYHLVQNLLYSHVPSKNIKIKIYTTMVLPAVLYKNLENLASHCGGKT
jgi:hypothetical protein